MHNSGEKSQKRERVRGKKINVREKVEKSRSTVFFQYFVAPGGSKSKLAKAAGAESSGRMKYQKLHAPVVRTRVEAKMVKTPQRRSAFGS